MSMVFFAILSRGLDFFCIINYNKIHTDGRRELDRFFGYAALHGGAASPHPYNEMEDIQ